MIKADIISSIAEKSGIEKVDVQTVVEGVMYEIKSSLERGENVYLFILRAIVAEQISGWKIEMSRLKR